jgi:tetratricopeptide (TPR) repeat protein
MKKYLLYFIIFSVSTFANAQSIHLIKLDEIQSIGFSDSVIGFKQLNEYRKNNKTKIVDAYSHKVEGIINYIWGNKNRALILYKISESLYYKYNLNEGIASLYNNIAVLYYDLNKDKEAIDYYNKAVVIAKKEDNYKILSIASGNLANIFIKLNIPSKAMFHSKNALIYSKQFQSEAQIFQSYTVLGSSYNLINQPKTALINFQKSLLIATQLKDSIKIATSLGNIGNCFLKLKNYDSCLIYINKALFIAQKINYIHGLSQSHNNLGIVYFNTKDYQNALKNFEFALKFSSEKEITEHKIYNYLNISLCHEKMGEFKKAFSFHKIHSRLIDSLRSIENSKKIIESEELFRAKERRLTIQNLEKQKRIEQQKKESRTLLLIISILAFFIVGFLSLIFFQRSKNKNKQKQIEQEKKQVEIEYRLLRSQMNPHFIFNALNSIHQYIQQNQNENASNMLLKFSKLIRSILQQSTKDFVALNEEILQLKNYIEIEQLRFNSKFTYQINIDEKVQFETISIPSLMLQPFIENAIIHGLQGLNDKAGELIINVIYLEENSIKVEIIDNGIGFKQVNDNKKHQSLALKITKERLIHLNPKVKEPIVIESSNEGTKIEVIIPIKNEF